MCTNGKHPEMALLKRKGKVAALEEEIDGTYYWCDMKFNFFQHNVECLTRLLQVNITVLMMRVEVIISENLFILLK